MTGQLDTLMDSTVYDSHDDKIGKVKNIYVNNETGSPTWVAVSTGLFRHDSLVPLVGAQHNPQADALRVSVDKEMVKSAPAVEQDGHISSQGEAELFRHYHVDPNHAGWDAYGRAVRGTGDGTGRQAQPGTNAPVDDRGMVRSEERLNVDTQREAVGTARLRKYVVTEDQTVTVPTSHEEVRVEREPVTSADARPDLGEQEQEVTLHRDRVTVDKETVPVERVRLAVDDVEEQQTVADTVRKERIETEGTDPQRRDDRRYPGER
ncbi:DUF2382 domain-containing protein [Nocardia veterana]|uniref:PRC and DUF2382 domain-containing protein n=2 Tax=Nocardia veterana TaxID=132249 RepID=A0A7X6M2V1_9NOCA|nr:PRC and DUF2382 domain-containing protein [Nocardia veterana]NKY89280.1 PRC and DUF2382 domain-containing protein [Nocardia veterana]